MVLPSSVGPISVTILATFLLLAFSDKVLSARGALSKTGKTKNGDGSKWYDKWYTSDTVYIDGDGTHAKAAQEGSGAGMVHSDLADIGSGSGPDDEDSVQGSGDDIDVEQVGSGDGIWIDHTSRPMHVIPSTSTQPSLWYKPKTTSTQRWWPLPAETTTSKIKGIVDFTDEEEDSNVIHEIEEKPTEPSRVRTTPPYNVVPTDSTIYDTREERTRRDPFFRPGILAAVIGGAVVGLLAAILLVMFIVYRMRKKDEGSYALDEPKQPPSYPYAYHKAPTKEFYA